MSGAKIVVGNWKMHGLRDRLPAIRAVAEASKDWGEALHAGLCVPTTLLYVTTTLTEETPLLIGAQDCHPAEKGAHTGDVSAAMIADCFAQLCIVGHSERRQDHGEDDALVRLKAEACVKAGLTPIVCIGETDEENRAGRTREVLERQLRGSLPDALGGNVIVAYEPIWAIGTGRVPGVDDIGDLHRFLHGVVEEVRGSALPILYGGSVKPGNASELMAIEGVDGALVGGASLEPEDFVAICEGARMAGGGGHSGTGS